MSSIENNKNLLISKISKFLANNDLDNVRKLSSEFVTKFPEDFNGYYFLANYYLKKNDFFNAEKNYLKSLKKNNKVDYLFIEIGNFYYIRNDLSKAIDYYNNALKLNSDSFELLNNIGLVYLKINHVETAISFFSKSLQINKNYTNALINRSVCFNMLNNYNDAIKDCEKIIKLDPKHASAYNNLGWAYLIKGNNEKAIVKYRKAIELQPNFIDAINNLGGAYFNLGDKKMAAKYFKKSLEIDPKNTETFRSLVLNKGIDINDSRIKQFYELYDKNEKELGNCNQKSIPKNILESHSSLCFALGFLNDNEKKYKEAYKYFERANKYFRLTYDYNIDIEESLFLQIQEVFDKKFYDKNIENGNSSSAPIFIIGMPRSGTTLVEQILSSHSLVIGLGEIEFIKKLTSLAIEKIPSKNLSNIKYLSSKDRVDLGNEYLKNISDLIDNPSKAHRFTDKQMLNFINLGFIKMIFPNAKIIHVKRNPMDNCFSIYSLRFNGHQPFAYNQVELGKYYKMYEKMMSHWRNTFPDYIYEVSYENLVENLQNEVKGILEFCNLNFEDSCINFYKNKRSVITSSSLQVREKIYSSAINRWKNYEKELKPLYGILKS